jgi:hypothetical protein
MAAGKEMGIESASGGMSTFPFLVPHPASLVDWQIHSILTTKEGEDEVEYRENVLYAWI